VRQRGEIFTADHAFRATGVMMRPLPVAAATTITPWRSACDARREPPVESAPRPQ
jgi:hypothetical protein